MHTFYRKYSLEHIVKGTILSMERIKVFMIHVFMQKRKKYSKGISLEVERQFRDEFSFFLLYATFFLLYATLYTESSYFYSQLKIILRLTLSYISFCVMACKNITIMS